MAFPCPTCAFPVQEGASRCPQCGRVFGEANRCPHCGAVAAVRPRGKRYLCLACGRERPFVPGMVVVEPKDAALQVIMLRGLGGLSLGTGVLALLAILGVFGFNAWTIVAGGLLGGVPIAIALLLFALARKTKSSENENLEAKVRRLLRSQTLTAKELGKALGITEEEADRIASELAARGDDGIGAHLDEKEGVLRFGVMPRVRVAEPEEDVAEVGEALGSEAHKQARGRARPPGRGQ
ncbi:MAG: zinc ribbon domain-containing protein [Sandaracinaceae bacterium]|nr:zinc ribbon domain-containing protein [Sandaracinaceae bacterium]MDW8245905.1 zinc ribbon domain-containing protein [Sandaracinaceae bacterium]